MVTVSTSAQRILLAGGFAVAAVAAPILMTLATPDGPAAPSVATCPSTEVFDPATGACRPKTDQTSDFLNPEPGSPALTPGEFSQTGPEPDISSSTCPPGQETGMCIANDVAVPTLQPGEQY